MTREELLASIATTIHDYRAGEIAQPSAEHVDRWVTQFDEEARLPILSEIDHVLKKTYFSRDTVLAFLNAVLIKKELASSDPCSFWPRVGILNIQLRGDSQREMIVLFDELLFSLCGLHTSDCGTDATTFVYLDDAIFTGNHVRNDLQRWIGQDAPKTSRVHIVTIAYHEGKYYANPEGCQGSRKDRPSKMVGVSPTGRSEQVYRDFRCSPPYSTAAGPASGRLCGRFEICTNFSSRRQARAEQHFFVGGRT